MHGGGAIDGAQELPAGTHFKKNEFFSLAQQLSMPLALVLRKKLWTIVNTDTELATVLEDWVLSPEQDVFYPHLLPWLKKYFFKTYICTEQLEMVFLVLISQTMRDDNY